MASPPHAKKEAFFPIPPKLLSLGQTGVIITVRLLLVSLLILGGNIASLGGLGGTDCVFCEMEMCLI